MASWKGFLNLSPIIMYLRSQILWLSINFCSCVSFSFKGKKIFFNNRKSSMLSQGELFEIHSFKTLKTGFPLLWLNRAKYFFFWKALRESIISSTWLKINMVTGMLCTQLRGSLQQMGTEQTNLLRIFSLSIKESGLRAYLCDCPSS